MVTPLTANLNLGGYFFTGGTTTLKAEDDDGAGDGKVDENINITATSTIKTAASDIVFNTAAIQIADGFNLTVDAGSGDVTLTDIHGVSTNATSDVSITGANIAAQTIGNSGDRDEDQWCNY